MGEQDDRAAILARRQRFIALAISGLSTGCTPGKPGPTPTTASTSSTTLTPTTDGDSEESEESDDGSEATAPSACLKFDVGSPPKFDMPAEDETSESESESGDPDVPKLDLPPEDESGSGAESEGGAETGPQPCLAPMGLVGSLPE